MPPRVQRLDAHLMQTSFPGYDHVEAAIELLRIFEPTALKWQPQHGYWLAYSAGKDSTVLLDLAIRSGVRFEPFYNVTTIDPPELVKFMREHHPEVKFNRLQKIGMIEKAASIDGLPTRKVRWCCEDYKHTAAPDWVKILGVRAAESQKRHGVWRTVSPGMKAADAPCINPIVAWSDSDVWDYIRDRKLAYCSLYDEGFKRLGCVGCPLNPQSRIREFQRWPIYKKMWHSAAVRYWNKFHGTLNSRGEPRLDKFNTAEEYWNWWMEQQGDDTAFGQCEFGMA